MPFAKAHPLLVPEMVLNVSLFVSLRDAVVCARVCKTWNDPFTSAIWHSIDFGLQPNLLNSGMAIKKHGHRIRVIKELKNLHQLTAIHHSSVCRIRKLHILIPANYTFHVYCGDILRQNAASIIKLDIAAQSRPDNNVWLPFPFDAISLNSGNQATSNITSLTIENILFTRDGFSSLLRMCPALEVLNMRATTIRSANCSEPFQHTGLKELACPLEQIFRPDPMAVDTTSMLTHFPTLRSIYLTYPWPVEFAPMIGFEEIKTQFAQHCPLLREVSSELSAATTTVLLTQTFRSLESITVTSKGIRGEVIMGILAHQQTLKFVGTFAPSEDYEYEESPKSVDLPVPEWSFQLIPQTCSRLESFMFPVFELDMDEIEKIEWTCVELKRLEFRIRGLDTNEKIDRATQLWIDCNKLTKRRNMKDSASHPIPRKTRRKKKEESRSCPDAFPSSTTGEVSVETLCAGNSIEQRVARHLLRFKKLEAVWLGHGVKRVQV
ncbi:MAG: hypothetical protein J3Q66DRAFT_321849 [Benniella sp.]|nr:MAG: hypothetical protein J3Q66DRAFT_321849 [Benniella sp.]